MHGAYGALVATKSGRPAGASGRHRAVLWLTLFVAVGSHGPSALGQAGPEAPAEALFAELLDAVRVQPNPQPPDSVTPASHDRRRAVWSSDVYASLRAKLLALGPAAKEVVARVEQPDAPLLARVIAGGLDYELSHREQLVPFYEQIGRVVSGSRAFRGVSRRRRDTGMMMGMEFGEVDVESLVPVERAYDYEEPADLAEFGFRCFWASWSQWMPSPAEIPAPLRIEQAVAWPDDRRLRALADLRDHRLAFEVLQWVLLEEPDGRRPIMRDGLPPGTDAILSLAKVGGARAIDVYHRHLELRPTAYVEAVIQAIILIGDPRGANVLEAIAGREPHSFAPGTFSTPTYRAAAADARIVLPLLKDGPERLVELLGAESASLQLTAAVSLAGRGDLRAVPVLCDVAAAPLVPTFQRYWHPSKELADHQRARDALVRLGKPGLPALRQAAAQSKAVHAALLAEVVALHIERPKLVERFRMAGLLRSSGFPSMIGPSLRDYRVTGWQVADVLCPGAVPLLEAAIVWPTDPFRSPVAAFALARFRQERSIDVLVTHVGVIDDVRHDQHKGSLVVAVLEAFGAKGIAAARRLEAALERTSVDQSETTKPAPKKRHTPLQDESDSKPATHDAADLKGDS